jgi:hypothetical protein
LTGRDNLTTRPPRSPDRTPTSFSGGTQKSLLTVQHCPLLCRNYLGEYELLPWQLHLSCLQNCELYWNMVMIGRGQLRYPYWTTVNCWVKVTKTSSSSSSIRPKHVLRSCATYLLSNITIKIHISYIHQSCCRFSTYFGLTLKHHNPQTYKTHNL